MSVLFFRGSKRESNDFSLIFCVFFVLVFLAYFSFAVPLWVSSTNSTTPSSPATYNPSQNYSFQINFTNVTNTTFQLGLPSGGLANYTDNTTGLVGYWRMNYVNGTNYTKDFSGYANDGQLKNYDQCGSAASTCNLTSGVQGNALQFDGANDYVDVGNSSIFDITNKNSVWYRQGTVLNGTLPLEQNNIGEPTVLYENNSQLGIASTSTNIFKMWYTGGWTTPYLWYAESVDGLNWTKYSAPLLSNYARSIVFHQNTTYYWYVVDGTAGKQVDLYTSVDGLNFSLNATNILYLGSEGSWDSIHIGNIYVWTDVNDSDWKMLYEADGGSTWKIGLATSSNGINWTKSFGNPVISETGSVGGVGYVYKNAEGIYYLWLHRAPSGSLPTDGYRYRSSDLVSWTMDSSSIQRTTADEGVGSGIGQVADLSLLQVNNTTYLYYAASSDGSSPAGDFHIKLATVNYTMEQLTGISEAQHNKFSVAAWIYPNTFPTVAGQYRTILEKGYDGTNEPFFLMFDYTGGNPVVEFATYPASFHGVRYIYGNNIIAKNWYNIVGTYDGSTWRIYINGIEKNSSVDSTAPIHTSLGVSIGASNINGAMSRFFNGIIDEVRIYNRTLSAQEIASQYNMQYPYYAGTDDSLNGTWAINLTQAAIGGAGTYNYTWFGTDTAGNQNSTQTVGYTINKLNNVSLSFALNGTQGDVSYNYGTVSNATVWKNTTDGTIILYRNGTSVGNPEINLLGAKVYNYTATFSHENYSASQVERMLTTNKAATSMRLFLNGTGGNNTYNQNNVANFTAQLNVSKTITLTSNYTGWVMLSGTQTIFNYTTLGTLGNFFNITANWTGDENYTGGQKDYLFNVTDTTPPTLSIQLPQNATYASTSRTLNYTVSDNNAIGTCWYQYNGTNTTLANCANATFTGFEGTSMLILYANDTSGNINSANVTFTIDTIAPIITIVLPQNTTYGSTSRTLNFTAADATSGVNTTWFQNNGTNTTISGNVSFTALDSQQSSLILYANDSAGNVNSTSVAFIADATAPSVSLSISPSSIYQGQSLTITCSASDAYLSTTSLTVAKPGSSQASATCSQLFTDTSAAGAYTVTYSATDTAGNSATTQQSFSVNQAGGSSSSSSAAAEESKAQTITTTSNEATEKITVNLNAPMSGASVTIARMESSPVNVAPAADAVYQYLNITKNNFNNSQIKNASIDFKVSKSWIIENNITSVSLARYENGWKRLKTEMINQTASQYIYRAYTDGFYYFAIVGERASPAEAGTAGNVTQINQAPENIAKPSEPQGSLVYHLGIAAAVIAGILLIVIGFKFKNRRSRKDGQQ
jgi:PGF-pre-PGF domain-containing protein